MSAIITKESFGPDMTTIVVVGNVTCILLALRRTALVAWHVPALFRLGMHSYARHLWEQASFLSTRTSFLAAHRSALAERAAVAAMVDASVPFYRSVAV
jgi:hypothetical protein